MSLETAFAEQRVSELERAMHIQKSMILNVLLDLQVMIEDGDYDEALEHIKEHINV